jgi:hypothetical protein
LKIGHDRQRARQVDFEGDAEVAAPVEIAAPGALYEVGFLDLGNEALLSGLRPARLRGDEDH